MSRRKPYPGHPYIFAVVGGLLGGSIGYGIAALVLKPILGW